MAISRLNRHLQASTESASTFEEVTKTVPEKPCGRRINGDATITVGRCSAVVLRGRYRLIDFKRIKLSSCKGRGRGDDPNARRVSPCCITSTARNVYPVLRLASGIG
jgi:hypothetical protein